MSNLSVVANLSTSSDLVKPTQIPDTWDKVLTAFRRTLDRSGRSTPQKRRVSSDIPLCAGSIDSSTGFNCTDDKCKYIYTLAILRCRAWQVLCAKINERTADAAISTDGPRLDSDRDMEDFASESTITTFSETKALDILDRFRQYTDAYSVKAKRRTPSGHHADSVSDIRSTGCIGVEWGHGYLAQPVVFHGVCRRVSLSGKFSFTFPIFTTLTWIAPAMLSTRLISPDL